jgi:hypothetical protein
MFHIEYRLLCSISFEHTYYQNGKSSDFTVVPTQTCHAALKRYGLVLRKTANQMLIMQRMDDGLPETPFGAAVGFTFLVYLNNAQLWNISQFSWEVNPGEHISARQFYLTNLNEADGELLPRLTRDVRLSEKDALPRTSMERFNVEVKKGEFSEIVIEQFIPKVKWAALPPVTVKPDQEIVEVKLSEPGLYRLPPGIAGVSPPVFLANDEVARSSPLFAVADLFLDDTVDPGTNYVTYMDNRKFFWWYVLIDVRNKKVPYGQPEDIRLSFKKHDNDAQSPQVVTFAMVPEENQDPQLRRTIEQMIKTNQDSIEKVFVFASSVPIPIVENCPPVVELSMKDNPKFARLPIPDIGTIDIRGDQSLIYYHI